MLPSKTSILLTACLDTTHESQPHLFARNFTSGLDYISQGYNINITAGFAKNT